MACNPKMPRHEAIQFIITISHYHNIFLRAWAITIFIALGERRQQSTLEQATARQNISDFSPNSIVIGKLSKFNLDCQVIVRKIQLET